MSVLHSAILVWLTLVFGAAATRADSAEQANSVSNVALAKGVDGRWRVQLDYFFNGEPSTAMLEIEVTSRTVGENDPLSYVSGSVVRPELGAHHVTFPVVSRGPAQRDLRVVATLVKGPDKTVLLRQEIFAQIDAGNGAASGPSAMELKNQEELTWAITQIDEAVSANDLRSPREILENLIARDPRSDAAYVELARIAMKSDWGPDGLHQAELLLDSALKIRPDSVNARILLGYVYTHQKRYQEAQPQFVAAASSNPPNLWLWANWGEMFLLQGKVDEAIAKYREAIARPDKHDTYSRARLDAYGNLLKALATRNDLDGMEALYVQHAREGGRESCITVGYARFMLQIRGDAQRAIDIARSIPDLGCDGTSTRQILGLASYLRWEQSKGNEGLDALNQARIYLPAGARAFYLLAAAERTLPAARKLIGLGELIDQKDGERMTALSYALRAHDLEAAKRLLALGARPDVPVGPEDLPVALVSVFESDLDTIRGLRRAGVDYSKIQYQGMSAAEFAKRTANEPLLLALTGKQNGL